MNNKFLIIIVVIVAIWYLAYESVMDKLMKVEYPITVQEASGEQYYDPKRYSVVDMEDMRVSGLATVIHLYKKGCRGCEILNSNLGKLMSLRPDIAVVQIPSPWVVNYKATYKGNKLNIKSVPFVMIFDREGNLLASDDGKDRHGVDLSIEWLNEEVGRKNEQLREEWERKKSS